jgi:transposase
LELFEQIRREYENGVGTIKGVARKLGVHRRLVREALGDAVPKERKKPERERPKLSEAIPFVDAILTADRKAPRKQRHTAHRIYDRLRVEMPTVSVAESTVREYVREKKAALGLVQREAFIPQSYSWGSEGQVDWYEAWVDMDGERQKVQTFCMRSMASAGSFHRSYLHATQQAFLEAHEFAFDHFGGVFRKLRFDNLTSAVKKILRGHRREETARFIAFRSHWGFEADFCTPGEGHEKGGVENENGYFRRNHFVPVPSVRNLEELNSFLLAECQKDEQRIIHGRSERIGAAMLAEREHLLPLVEEGFDLAAVHTPVVNGSGCVNVLTNFYSAPLRPGTKTHVKVHAAYVEIWHEGQCLARHERCFSRQQKVLNLEHYLEALSKKPGALAGSTALEQWRAQGRWPASYDRFWEVLKQRQGKQEGTRAMIEVLLLGRKHGDERLRSAVEKALEVGCSDVGAVRYLLGAETMEKRQPVEGVDIGALKQYERPLPSLAEYDQLLASREVLQ